MKGGGGDVPVESTGQDEVIVHGELVQALVKIAVVD